MCITVMFLLKLTRWKSVFQTSLIRGSVQYSTVRGVHEVSGAEPHISTEQTRQSLPLEMMSSVWDEIGFESSLGVRSHSYEYESGYPYTASSKHKIAYIPVVAVHIHTSSVRVRVTCEFHSYE